MSPGDSRKGLPNLLLVKAELVWLIFKCSCVDEMRNYEHRNMHDGVALQQFNALKWFKMLTHWFECVDYAIILLNIYLIYS